MEITIRINNIRELNRIKKLLEGERINITIGKKRKTRRLRKLSKITEETFKKTDKGEDLVVCKNVDDFFQKLGL